MLRFSAALGILLTLTGCIIDPLGPIGPGPQPPPPVSTPQPSDEFAWGISTSSYQYEDPDVEPGDADFFLTDWDIFIEEGKAPEKGNALYSWTHFDKDLAALKKIGVTHYRFSVSWARCEPQPGVYNEAAIRRYAEMARRLEEAGIEPVVCLWHFTFPSWLYDRKKPAESNWLHPLARTHWRAFVDRMVRATAPYTNHYAPQNEPNGQITTAYLVGQWPPGMDLAFGHYWKAIDASVAMFRDAAQQIKAIKPTAKVMSVEALPWWEHPPFAPGRLIYDTMLHQNVDHLDRIHDVCDIVGINYYYSEKATLLGVLAVPHQRGKDFSMMGWRIDPQGLYNEIQRVATRYGKPMMITENGIATPDDSKRIAYVETHLAAIARAIRDGYDVRGYFAWSLADNYEWHYGYEATFGLARMDPKTYDRVLKPSARKFADWIRHNRTVRSVSKFHKPPPGKPVP
ncbi:MAG: family 1 glycosylhydrolase [Chthoniobacterales bacterium]